MGEEVKSLRRKDGCAAQGIAGVQEEMANVTMGLAVYSAPVRIL